MMGMRIEKAYMHLLTQKGPVKKKRGAERYEKRVAEGSHTCRHTGRSTVKETHVKSHTYTYAIQDGEEETGEVIHVLYMSRHPKCANRHTSMQEHTNVLTPAEGTGIIGHYEICDTRFFPPSNALMEARAGSHVSAAGRL